jgi:hypothetical protein
MTDYKIRHFFQNNCVQIDFKSKKNENCEQK